MSHLLQKSTEFLLFRLPFNKIKLVNPVNLVLWYSLILICKSKIGIIIQKRKDNQPFLFIFSLTLEFYLWGALGIPVINTFQIFNVGGTLTPFVFPLYLLEESTSAPK